MTPEIKRITTAEVARRLDCDPETVRAYANEGWIKEWTPTGKRGKGIGLRFDLEEINEFIRGGAPAAAAYRARLAGDGKPTRRGRGRKKVTA